MKISLAKTKAKTKQFAQNANQLLLKKKKKDMITKS